MSYPFHFLQLLATCRRSRTFRSVLGVATRPRIMPPVFAFFAFFAAEMADNRDFFLP
jgi:hypothetical protein